MEHKKVIVRGPALSRSGYGEQCRFALRSLRAHEDMFDIFIALTGWGQTNWLIENDEERQWIDQKAKETALMQQNPDFTGYDVSLQVTIPNEWEKLAPINIGYTAGIEATKVSPVWIEKSMIMDKIIVVSDFAKQIFDTTKFEVTNNTTGEKIPDFGVQTLVEAVNYPVKHIEPAEINLELDTDFNFLVVAQWGIRKNLTNAVKWFVEEFKNQEVGMVLKINMLNNSNIDKHHVRKKLKSLLSEYEDRKCKIHLVHGNMSDAEMTALYQHPKIKAIISNAHGEGFGLPLFEAAYNALPIIAPAWSGYCDFLYAPVKNKKTGKTKIKALFARVDYNLAPIQDEAVWKGVLEPGVQWCYTEENSFKSRLREVFKDVGRFESQAKQLKKHIEENFKEEDQYRKFTEAFIGADVNKAREMHKEEVIVL